MNPKIFIKNFVTSISSPPYSRLFFVGDSANWVLSWEIKETRNVADTLGIKTAIAPRPGLSRQSIFYASKYILANPLSHLYGFNNVAFSYFHGYPDSGEPNAVKCYKNLIKHHKKISRIQVSHSRMRDVLLSTPIDPVKIHLIPIAINPDFFQLQTPQSKIGARRHFDIPETAVVVGSFQKDGNGWGEGLEPKLIKGPDVFLDTVKILKESISELFVLLSGPARGFVKKGLEKLKIPYKHIYLDDYPQIGQLYQCLDLYIISSREEGGPKAILESMASGVPLVTTRVGQAMDMVNHQQNAMMTEPENHQALAQYAKKILSNSALRETLIKNGLETAKQNTYKAHTPLWKNLFEGFVKINPQ